MARAYTVPSFLAQELIACATRLKFRGAASRAVGRDDVFHRVWAVAAAYAAGNGTQWFQSTGSGNKAAVGEALRAVDRGHRAMGRIRETIRAQDAVWIDGRVALDVRR